MADDTFNNDNQESLMGDDEFTEVEATVIEDGEEVEQEESLEAKINHGIGTLDINVGKVSETDFAREMRTSFLEYSMSVIVARALPDVRDGLKPVHRRILYAMNESGITPNKPHVKCARPVGDCMGKYHPHGDAAIYDTLVRLAQDFSMRVPLIDGHGNFGSIDGDGAAAMRASPICSSTAPPASPSAWLRTSRPTIWVRPLTRPSPSWRTRTSRLTRSCRSCPVPTSRRVRPSWVAVASAKPTRRVAAPSPFAPRRMWRRARQAATASL